MAEHGQTPASSDPPSPAAGPGAAQRDRAPNAAELPPPLPVDQEPLAPPPPPPPPPPRKPLRGGWLALDRAAVLLVGVAVGVMIGAAFMGQGGRPAKPPTALASNGPNAPTVQTIGQDCPIPYPPHLLATLAANQPINVGVFGDSFGDGVWAALYHLLPKNYHVLRFSKESTGFTRYATNNLEDAERDQLAQGPVDVAVIDFGANDVEGIYDGAHAWPLLSDGWKTVYGQRMDRFVNALRAQGAMVYWVGLPVMRKPDYDSQISDMLSFYDQRMTALGVPFIDVRALSEDSSGQYNDYLTSPGQPQPRLMRAGDGVHMTMAGYERLAQPVVDRIEAYVARARASIALDAPPAQPPAVSASQGAPSHAS